MNEKQQKVAQRRIDTLYGRLRAKLDKVAETLAALNAAEAEAARAPTEERLRALLARDKARVALASAQLKAHELAEEIVRAEEALRRATCKA